MAQSPLTRDQLIAIRDGNKRNQDVRALLREIKRLKNVLAQAEELRKIIDREWQNEHTGHLTALHSLRALLSAEADWTADQQTDVR